jgi:signal transduction histidine kinase/CheY-like chemotaxis protein
VTSTPSAGQIRIFWLLSLLYAALTAAVIPYAGEPGPADPEIVVVYAIGILVADFCTAALLGALYRGTGRVAFLVLACAFLFGGLMAAAHMATFPGALGDAPLVGNWQTVAWLFLAWRIGVPSLLLAAVVVEAKGLPPHGERLGARLFAACLLTVAAFAVVLSLAARLRAADWGGERFAELATGIQWAAVALNAGAFALIVYRRAFGDLLYLWLGLALVVAMADLTLSNFSLSRYTAGWYAARANALVSACLLLAFLLGDAAGEERRLKKASTLAAYGGAVAVTFAAVFMRWFLDPWLGADAASAMLYGAVAIAVWFGGLGPAVLAMVLGYAIINVRYISPDGAVSIHGPPDALALGLFTLSCSLIIVLGEAMRRAADRSRASAAEVKARARELQRADENKSRFLAVLSHELRNPLAPLRTGVALLRKSPAGHDAQETHDMMERQITQLARLIDDLLDVSRIDRGKLELRAERMPVDAVMRTAIDTAKPNLDAQGHELVVRFPEKALFVEGDLVRLSQVVSNLLNNAAKFTPPSGRIELSARAEEGKAVLRVADNGIGIAPERLAEIFDMFVQLAPGGNAGGLGLGLTLARSIVRRHGGEILARSPGPGKGAEFLVMLPLAAALASETPREPAAAAEARSRRRVLVVDDNVDAAQTLAAYLRLDGHRVESALDGEAALRTAEVLRPDVAFIDLNMPRMDGAEVARRLRITPWGRKAHLVALTGMGQPADVARTQQAGFDQHLTKPADLQRVSQIAAGAGASVHA